MIRPILLVFIGLGVLPIGFCAAEPDPDRQKYKWRTPQGKTHLL